MQLHYRKYGEGPPLIILHGLFGSSDNWHGLAKRWAQSFTVYTIDQRNHGGSPHESAMDYVELAHDLSQFVDQQRLGPVNIVGHSMGGKVAMLFATAHPERVTSLVILDMGISQVRGKHGAIMRVLEELDLSDFTERKEIQDVVSQYIESSPIRQFLLKNIMRRIDGSFSWKFNHITLLDHYDDLTAALDLKDSYMGPTLFLRGALSPYLAEHLDPGILQYFPFAQIESIEEAGHWLHAEQPDIIFSMVKDFLLGD